jgi:hypothetical protein
MSMRIFVLAALFLLSLPTFAQPALRATQLAEFADGLSQPHDAAFSPDGKLIYLTDMRNSRIQVLEAMTLKPVGRFGAGELSYPHDAEFDQAGRLLVADTGNDRVAIYEIKGAQAKLVGELKGLAGPEGVAVMPDGGSSSPTRATRRSACFATASWCKRPAAQAAGTASCAIRMTSKSQAMARCMSSIRPITASRCSTPRCSIAPASALRSA